MKSRGEGLRGCEPTFSLCNFWPSVVLRLVLASLSLFSPGCCLFVNYIRYEEEAFCAGGGKGVDRALKWMPGIEEIRRLLGPSSISSYLSSHCSSRIVPLANPPLRTLHIRIYTDPYIKMRLLCLLLVLLAPITLAQTESFNKDQNPFTIPRSGFSFTAGEASDINWSPTTNGTVSIILRSGPSSNFDHGEIVACMSSLNISLSSQPYKLLPFHFLSP